MVKSKKYGLILICSLMIVFLIACQNNQVDRSPNRENLQIQNIRHLDQDDHQINQSVQDQFDEITDLTSVTYNHEIIMAIQVNSLAQFNEQQIAIDIEDYLGKMHPEIKATVSSDYKIFLEINRLKQKITTENLTSKDFKQQFGKIIKLTETPED